MRKKFLKNIEWYLIIAAVILSVVGLVALFSATYESGLDEFKKQIIWLIIGLIIMIAVMFINYEILAKISPVFYVLSIIMLLIGIMITIFGLHLMSKASINLLEYINDIFY